MLGELNETLRRLSRTPDARLSDLLSREEV
jgi:hypothetical protein